MTFDQESAFLLENCTCSCSSEAQDERYGTQSNHRGTAEQWIKEGKNAVRWTRLSCRSMKANAVRLQLHALAYNLANSCGRWRRRNL